MESLNSMQNDNDNNNFDYSVDRRTPSEVAKIRTEQLDGRTPIQLLIDTITTMREYQFDVPYDSNGELLSFFFLHEKSVARYNRFPSVLILDSTYKTNRLKMPFLEAVGMTSNNRTFFPCGCFMTKEATQDYTGAVSKMKELCFIDASPEVIATDRERALILAINQVLPSVRNLCAGGIFRRIYHHHLHH